MKGGLQRGSRIILLLAVLAIFSIGCRLITVRVAAYVTVVAPSPFPPGRAVPPVTHTPLSTPTGIPTPVVTPTPFPSQTPAPYSGQFRLVAFFDEILPGKVEALVSNKGGTLWLVTESGVARLLEDSWNLYLDGYRGTFAGISPDGRAWVVDENGSRISAWDGMSWTGYGEESGWISLKEVYNKDVHGGQGDSSERFWFATSQDVRVFDGSQWTVFTPEEMGMGAPLYEDLMPGFDIIVATNGVVWVSECDWGGPGPFGGRGIRWLEKDTWLGASSPVASGCATVLVEDSQGGIWAGVDNSLWRYEPASGAWTEFTLPEPPVEGMRFGFIDSLVIGSQDTIWAVLNLCGGASCFVYNALYHFDGELWTQHGEVAEFDDNYWGPIFDRPGIPWFHWEGGIYRAKGEGLELASPLPGRFGAIDQSGNLWIIASYNNREALWVLEGETKK